MWSLQAYDPESMKSILKFYAEISKEFPKPLMVTEFGASAKLEVYGKGGVYNETYQTNEVKYLWDIITSTKSLNLRTDNATNTTIGGGYNDGVVAGALVMQWADEWWKSNVADSAHAGCPNNNPNIHRDCGVALSSVTFIHEAWLGINYQIAGATPLIGSPELCIAPRAVYGMLRALWTGVNETSDVTFDHQVACATLTQKDPLLYVVIPLVVLIIVYFIVWAISRLVHHVAKKKKPAKQRYSIAERGGMYIPEHRTMTTSHDMLDMLVEAAFVMYTSHNGPDRMQGFFRSCKDAGQMEVGQLNRLVDDYNLHVLHADSMGGGEGEGSDPNSYFVNEARIPSSFIMARKRIVHLIWDRVVSSQEIVGVVPYNIDGTPKRHSEIQLEVRAGDHDMEDDMSTSRDNLLGYRGGGGRSPPHALQASGSHNGGMRKKEFDLIVKNIKFVYIRYFEGYHLWKDSKSNIFSNQGNIPGRGRPNDMHWADMLVDLVLWNVVSQCAGTINHSPEKVCEVFDHTLRFINTPGRQGVYGQPWRRTAAFHLYHNAPPTPISNRDVQDSFPSAPSSVSLENQIWNRTVVPDNITLAPHVIATYQVGGATYTFTAPMSFQHVHNYCMVSRQSLALALQYTGDGMLVQSIMQIFRQYYDDVATHQVNFDDVNEDAFGASLASKIRRKLNRNVRPAGPGNASWAPLCETFLSTKIIHGATPNGPNRRPLVTPITFPHRGGVFSMIVNYGWIMRLNLWLFFTVWFFLQDNQDATCVASVLPMLAIADCALMIAVYGLEYFVTLTLSPPTLVLLGYHIVALLAVLAVDGVVNIFPPWSQTIEIAGTSFVVTTAVLYIAVTAAIMIIDEIYISARPAPFAVAGRQRNGRLERQVWGGFWAGAIIAAVIGVIVWVIVARVSPSAAAILGQQFDLFRDIFGVSVNALVLIACAIALVLGTALGVGMGRLSVACRRLGRSERLRRAENVWDEVKYVLMTISFWAFTLVIYWVVLFQILIPSVVGVTPRSCECNPVLQNYNLDAQPNACLTPTYVVCVLGVILTWSSTIIVSFVALFMCYTIVSLAYGLAIAATNQIGSVKAWSDISKYFERIQTKCFPVMSRSMMFSKNHELLWNQFIDSLHDEFLLTNTEHERLQFRRFETEAGKFKTPPDLSRAVVNKEAMRRLMQFCWSQEAMLKQSKRIRIPEFRRWFQVRTMPSWTVIVPCFTETTFYSLQDLQRPSDRPRISVIEYLAASYPDEWENFASQLYEKTEEATVSSGSSSKGAPRPVAASRVGAELLRRFLNTPIANPANVGASSSLNVNTTSSQANAMPSMDLEEGWGEDERVLYRAKRVCSPAEVSEVCYWASMRGQTLVRTLKGLMNYRAALERLARMEEGIIYLKDESERNRRCAEVHQMVRSKFQIILAYQIYSPDRYNQLWTRERQASFVQMLRHVWGFDLVYNHPNDRQSCMITFDRVGSMDPCAMWDEPELGRVTASNRVVINRPGPLVIGEPKAENQQHALAFALNEVIQVNDMNMYNTLEDSFKIPFLMNTFFAAPDDWRDPTSIIPAFRIVGFPEHTYTRPLSAVGDLMGSAEFCFVTITQRVLSALRVRMHYGHPDFLDGYWVRNRGGVSKASHLINTNEDIFTGYEMLGRDERGTYVDWLSQEKGRETSFMEAFTFEAKLAQGAAQQIRSRHLFYLNKRLPILVKLSLFFGSIGFYLMTLLTTFSIKLYVYSLLMFVGSGVSYHRLGLLGSVIAVPWLFQVGFVQALPLLLEYIIHYGLVTGTLAFLAQLPFGLVFFVFHLKTKAHYFAQGLFSAQGGYKGTGRGFGLDRRGMVEVYKAYFHSHFQDALILIAAVIVYSIISDETSGAIFLRLASIILVIFSWLMAPVLFNPYPTRDSLYEDIRSMRDWLQTKMHKGVDFRTANEGDASGPKSETERKAQVATWWNKQEEMSWQAWFVRNTYVDVWETADRWYSTPLNGVIWYAQQVLFLCWRYLPWIFLFQIYWRLDSVYYAVLAVVVFLLIKSLEFLFASMHEYFTLMKIIPLLLIPPILVFYHYGRMTAFQLLLSMLVYILGIFVLIEVSLGVWNILVKFGTFRDRKSGKWVAGSKGRKYLKRRLQVPRAMFHPQIIWPYLTMGVLAIGNFLTVAISGSLTAVLYNGRVSDMWNRAYMHHRLG
eukprot:TRINITY_DN606_c0_g1_i3.p1 TRINITY_DN606_c0_g1~~TRINITY_DN606_c0_g1_i3.p1  ORF type:complete len:2408 (-),score=581.57 TRINITY_DN606_c0_g1_i3:45-6527(-)